MLICELEAGEDPRTGNATNHKLGAIHFIAIAAGITGADTWNQTEVYVAEHEEFFRQYPQLSADIPTHAAFNRGFSITDPTIPEKGVWENGHIEYIWA